MAIAVTTTKNALANAYAALGSYMSLHTAAPTGGASEATGGSPAYGRKQTTWGTASGSTVAGTEVTFDVPAGTYTHWGLWTAPTGGTFLDGGALSASVTLSAQGQVKAPISYTQS